MAQADTSLDAIAGAGCSVTLSDGKDYMLSQLTLADIAAIKEWERTSRVKAVMSALATPGHYVSDQVRAGAIAKAACEPVDEIQAQRGVAGMMFLIWRSLLRKHPKMTYEQCGVLVGDNVERILELRTLIDSLSGFEPPEGEPDPKRPLSRA